MILSVGKGSVIFPDNFSIINEIVSQCLVRYAMNSENSSCNKSIIVKILIALLWQQKSTLYYWCLEVCESFKMFCFSINMMNNHQCP